MKCAELSHVQISILHATFFMTTIKIIISNWLFVFLLNYAKCRKIRFWKYKLFKIASIVKEVFFGIVTHNLIELEMQSIMMIFISLKNLNCNHYMDRRHHLLNSWFVRLYYQKWFSASVWETSNNFVLLPLCYSVQQAYCYLM